MTFTTTPPTKPGYFAARHKEAKYEVLVDVYLNADQELVCICSGIFRELIELADYEWCRLVPACDYVPKEEVKKAYNEGWTIEDYVDVEDAWLYSRAKRVMEGEST